METNHKTFNAFDKVLVKAEDAKHWSCDLYSHFNEKINLHETIAACEIEDNEILPYEGNEHLVGTTDEPDEEVKLEEGEYIMVSDYFNHSQYGWTLRRFIGINNFTNSFLAGASDDTSYRWDYAIRFSDFNPNDMEETKKHILCAKNGKVVKYRG